MLSRSEIDYSKMKKEKWEYYTGKANPSVYAEKPFSFKSVLNSFYSPELFVL